MAKTLDTPEPKTPAAIVAGLPSADDNPAVAAILARHVSLVTQISEAKREREKLLKLLPKDEGVTCIGGTDERVRRARAVAEARRLATSPDAPAPILAEIDPTARVGELGANLESLTAANDLVTAELSEARRMARNGLEGDVRRAAGPLVKAFAVGLLESIAAWWALAELQNALARKGLPTAPASVPVNPFAATIGTGQTALNGIGRLIAQFVAAGQLTPTEADAWRAKFPGCG